MVLGTRLESGQVAEVCIFIKGEGSGISCILERGYDHHQDHAGSKVWQG